MLLLDMAVQFTIVKRKTTMTSSQVNVSETPPMSASDLEGLKDDNGLYAGKFKTVEDLVGSYKELEGKLGAIDQTREEPEGVAEEETEEQETETNDSEFDAEEILWRWS